MFRSNSPNSRGLRPKQSLPYGRARQTLFAVDLTRRLFTSQEARAPASRAIPITSLDPFLRGLLFTDGTVTRALEVHTLDSVCVRVLEQAPIQGSGGAAAQLAIATGDQVIRRRVVMESGAGSLLVAHAESYVVPCRLPADFMRALGASPEGIGECLEQLHLECRRELLWFGLSKGAQWTGENASVLARCYRLIVGGHPAILITESFVVEQRAGIYRLVAVDAIGRHRSARARGHSLMAG